MTEKEVGEQLLHKINIETHGGFDALLVESNICPLCVSKGAISRLSEVRGERVCKKCGFVSGDLKLKSTVPFSETRSPGNFLAWDKNLGNTLGREGLFCVLARTTGTEDLPLRARHITTITQKFVHPKIATMLRLGRQLAHEWGFENHNEPKSVMFSNILGRVIRRVGSYLVVNGLQFNLKHIVNACFVSCLRENAEEYARAKKKLHVDKDILHTVMFISSNLQSMEANR